MTSYCTPKPVDASRLILLRGESVESRLQREQRERDQALKKARRNRKKKLGRTNFKLGDDQ
jgi:hypothetical protein